MVAWLEQHRGEIEAWPFGQIRLDWSPGDIKTTLAQVDTIGPKRRMMPTNGLTETPGGRRFRA
jgi:hypothetical protein